MEISGTQLGAVGAAQLRKIDKPAQAAGVSAAQSFDQVLLSTDAGAVEAARNIVAKTPDVRLEKVEQLRQQIQAGTYHVSAEKIADRMLTEGRLSSKIVEK